MAQQPRRPPSRREATHGERGFVVGEPGKKVADKRTEDMTHQDSGPSDATLDRLRARAAAAPLPDVLILPSQVRNERSYYSELDVGAVKVARTAGVKAEFLDNDDDRRFLGEYSADVFIQFAVAVAQQLTISGVTALAKYLLAQLGSLHDRGLIRSPDQTRVRVDIERVDITTPSHSVALTGVRFEAVGRHAVTQVVRGVADTDTAQAVIRELDLPDVDAQE